MLFSVDLYGTAVHSLPAAPLPSPKLRLSARATTSFLVLVRSLYPASRYPSLFSPIAISISVAPTSGIMRGGGKPAGSCLPCNQQARSAPFHDSPCVESPEIPLAPPRPLCRSPRSHPYSSHTVDSNTESAIASYRCLLVPRASSLSVTLRLGSFTRQVSPYFVLRPALSLYARPSPPLASSLTQTLSLCRPRSAARSILVRSPCYGQPRQPASTRRSRWNGTHDARVRWTRMGNKRTGRGVEEDAEVLSTDGAKLLPESRPAPGSRSKPRPRERTNQAFQSDMNLRAWRAARARRLTAGGQSRKMVG